MLQQFVDLGDVRLQHARQAHPEDKSTRWLRYDRKTKWPPIVRRFVCKSSSCFSFRPIFVYGRGVNLIEAKQPCLLQVVFDLGLKVQGQISHLAENKCNSGTPHAISRGFQGQPLPFFYSEPHFHHRKWYSGVLSILVSVLPAWWRLKVRWRLIWDGHNMENMPLF